jgi:hypothetical protein
MKLEDYKKACKLQTDIRDLQSHLRSINSQDLGSYTVRKIIYESTKYAAIITVAGLIPPFSISEYAEKVEEKITELEKEFESL